MTPEVPNPNPEGVENPQGRAWQEKVEKVGKRLDRVGGEMDSGIIEAVAALNIHGIPTSGSCEGHLDHGIPSPWIAIEAKNRPAERFNNQNKVCEEVAKKYNMTTEELFDGTHDEEWAEAIHLFEANGETEAYKVWQEKATELRKQVEVLVEEYTKQQSEKSSSKVSLTPGNGSFRIITGGEDHKLRAKSIKDLPEAEKEALAQRLKEHQAEMRRFTDYLKQKYFTKK